MNKSLIETKYGKLTLTWTNENHCHVDCSGSYAHKAGATYLTINGSQWGFSGHYYHDTQSLNSEQDYWSRVRAEYRRGDINATPTKGQITKLHAAINDAIKAWVDANPEAMASRREQDKHETIAKLKNEVAEKQAQIASLSEDIAGAEAKLRQLHA